jgi:hypothetical protein
MVVAPCNIIKLSACQKITLCQVCDAFSTASESRLPEGQRHDLKNTNSLFKFKVKTSKHNKNYIQEITNTKIVDPLKFRQSLVNRIAVIKCKRKKYDFVSLN